MTKGGVTAASKNLAKRILASVVLCLLVASGFTAIFRQAFAASAPNIITYQGRLLNSNGVPVAEATVPMLFQLYTLEEDGVCVWSNSSSTCATTDTRDVSLTDGLFSENLGDTNAALAYAEITDSIFADNAALYLQVTVNGESLDPRKQITAAPYALNADTLDGFSSTQAGGTSALALVLDNSGNLQLTGNPSGAGVANGSLYINPAGGDVGGNDVIFGAAVGAASRFRIDAEGDSFTAGDITLDGDDLVSTSAAFNLLNTNVTTLTMAGAATELNINNAAVVSTINIGGTNTNGTNTVNIATHNGAGDVISIGNDAAATTLGLTGGTAWSIAANGLMTTSNDVAVNGGDFTSTSAAFNLLNSNVTTLTMGSAATAVDLFDGAVVSAIDIGGVTNDGTNTINIATNDASADTISVGNANAATVMSLTGGNDWSIANTGLITTAGDLAVNGGDITSTSAAFNFLNANVTTLTMAGAATIIDFNNAAVTSNINIGGTSNDGANTVSIATNNTSADTINVGNNNAGTAMSLTGGSAWSIAANGLVTTSNDLAVNGGDLTSTSAAFNFLNANVTTLAMAGAATTLDINNAAVTSTINIGGNGLVNGENTVNIANNNTTADTIVVGNDNAGTLLSLTGGNDWSVTSAGLITTAGDLAVNGGDITSTLAAFNLLNTNVTTLTMASAATVIDFNNAAVTSSINIGGTSADGANTVGIATNNTTADTITMGNDNAATLVSLIGGNDWSIGSNGLVTTANDVAVNGGDLTSTSAAFNLLNANVTTLAMAGAATTLDINNAAVNSTINIGGTSANGANTVNIATDGATGDLITIGNGAVATTLGLTGGTAWSIGTNGLITTSNNLNVNGGQINSTAGIAITSTGGNITLNPNGSGMVSTAAGDSFAVGNGALAAAFSVDEPTNTVRIGDGVNDANDPKISFFSSDATNSGTLGYGDDDRFNFNNGNVNFNGTGFLPGGVGGMGADVIAQTTLSGITGNNLQTLQFGGGRTATTYSAVEGGGTTDHVVAAESHYFNISGAGTTLTRGYATRSILLNDSTNATLVQGAGYLAASQSEFTHNAAGTTLAIGYGVNSAVAVKQGTLTTGVAVQGEVAASAGTFDTGYAGRFKATSGSTNRFGVFAEASGGLGLNISGYFAGSRVQIDADSTPDVPGLALGPGDLFVTGVIETDGGAAFGDTSGTDQFDFASGVTVQNAVDMNFNALTSGNGLAIERAGGGADYDGKLLTVAQLNTSATSDAKAFSVMNMGGGNSVGAYITQNSTSGHVANATGNNALVIDINENGSADNAVILRSDADNNGTGTDTEFRITTQGDVYMDGNMQSASTSVGGADYAEFFKSQDPALRNSLLACQDPALAEGVKLCAPGSEPMGVVSTNAGIMGNTLRDDYRDMLRDENYRLIGVLGQIETLVNAGEGSIAIGDPITTSSIMAGYGAKAIGPARVVGFALESLASGAGSIKVLVQPQWYGGDVFEDDGTSTLVTTDLALASLAAATATSPAIGSESLAFRGSVWLGNTATTRQMSIDTSVASANDYQFVIRNNDGDQVAYVNDNGDFGVSGRFFPSDRGIAQSNRYIYYDGSTGGGGDFMRTNAAGWATGSYDFAEMFPSPDRLAPGEVVVFGDAREEVKRSSNEPYNQRIAGVVSTRPGFLAGENRSDSYPIALAGRVPTYVSTENGTIAIGDPLTTSSRPGYAMKATEPGPIIGYATEAFSGTTGSVIAFINVSYYDGGPAEEGPAAENSISEFATQVTQFDLSGSLNLGGGSILSIGSLQGIGTNWRLEEDGDLVTRGRLVQVIRSHGGEDVETYVAGSRQMTVQLSGTTKLVNGHAFIEFERIDPAFNDIISPVALYRVLLTPYAATGTLYAAERTNSGFIVRDVANSSDVQVDWLVIAVHKDYEREALEQAEVVSQPPVQPTETSEAPVIVEVPVGNAQQETVEQIDDVTESAEQTTVELPGEVHEITEVSIAQTIEEQPSTPDASTPEEPVVTMPSVE